MVLDGFVAGDEICHHVYAYLGVETGVSDDDWLVSVVIVVDIDECAPGGVASACQAPSGTCAGHLRDGMLFQCVCQPGYQLTAGNTSCEGLYE